MLAMAKVIAIAASIAIMAVLSRLLPKASYGAFSQVLVLYMMSSIVFQVGIPQSIFYFMPRLSGPEQRGFILQSLGLLLAQGGMLGAGLYLGADWIGKLWNSPELPGLLRAFAPYPIFMIPILAGENVLIALKCIRTVVLFNIVAKTLQFFVVVMPIYLGYGMIFAIRCWVALAAVELCVAIWLMLRPIKATGIQWSWSALVRQYRYALPFGMAAVLAVLGIYADKVVVNTFGTPELFAVYVNGAIELPVVGVIGAAVTMAILPSMVRFAKDSQSEQFLALWHRSQTKVAVILFLLLGWLLFFGPEAIVLLFSRRYAESAILFQIFLCLIPARLCSFQSIMVPLRRNWHYAASHLLQLVVAYGLCLVLFRYLGKVGAALGLVGAVYVNIATLGYFTSRAIGIRWAHVWAFRKLGLNLAIALGCGGVSFLLFAAMPSSCYLFKAIRLFGGGLIMLTLYVVLLSATGLLNLREWRSSFLGGAALAQPVEAAAAASPEGADQTVNQCGENT